MTAMVREDILFIYFGNICSSRRNKKADTSAERTCQSKLWHVRMKSKRWRNGHLTLLQISSRHDPQPPSPHLKLDIILIPNSAENHRLIPKACKMAKTEISKSNKWRTRAKVMILRNDKNRNSPNGEKGSQSCRSRKTGKREVKTRVSWTVGQLLL